MIQRILLIGLCTLCAACNQPSSKQNVMTEQTQSDTDDGITQQVNNWLMSDSTLSMDAQNIQVMTNNGVVTLDGRAANQNEKNKIMGHVKSIRGVKSVKDNLSLTSK